MADKDGKTWHQLFDGVKIPETMCARRVGVRLVYPIHNGRPLKVGFYMCATCVSRWRKSGRIVEAPRRLIHQPSEPKPLHLDKATAAAFAIRKIWNHVPENVQRDAISYLNTEERNVLWMRYGIG